MKRALIIGGGVAGPVAAMALQRAGIDATVYEAHEHTARDVGSYLTVATNGLDALRAIDAHRPVAAAGFPTDEIVLMSGGGKRLGVIPIGKSLPDGTTTVTIRRSHLHRALHDEARRRGIHFSFGKRLLEASTTPSGVLARFADGTAVSADLLIGCDGIHSATRRAIDAAAPAPRFVGLLNFGGYTRSMAPAQLGQWRMIFGKRAFFGYATDRSRGTVWFANAPCKPVSRAERDATPLNDWKHRLLDLFAGDRGPAAELIWAGRLEVAADNTHDLPSVPTWHRGRICLIGDAAHAPSPTSGQGASLAIEDAVILARCLRDVPGIPEAFAIFERLRRSRVERIVAHGARGSSNKTVGPAGRIVRDLLLPIAFKYFVTERSVAWIYDHHIDWSRTITTEMRAA